MPSGAESFQTCSGHGQRPSLQLNSSPLRGALLGQLNARSGSHPNDLADPKEQKPSGKISPHLADDEIQK